jgi:ATP-dependent helicase YprA (DUF1998 family)
MSTPSTPRKRRQPPQEEVHTPRKSPRHHADLPRTPLQTIQSPRSPAHSSSNASPEPPSLPPSPTTSRKAALPIAASPIETIWPRCCRIVRESEVAACFEAQFRYPPRSLQMRAGLKLMSNNDVMVVARTGIGKSKIFAVTAIAAQLGGIKHAVVLVIVPLKALEMDLVSSMDV